jgi:hypothetical protein
MEGQPKQKSKVERTIAAAAILGVAIPLVYWLITGLVGSDSLADSQPDSRLIAWLATFVVVGIIAAVGAATIAGTSYPRRGAGAVVLIATMTAALALGQIVVDLLFDEEDLEVGLGSLVVTSVVIAAIPVTLGALLGYALGSGRRPA